MMMMVLMLYIIGIVSLILNRFHLMMILMSIEFMYMSMTLLMLFYFSFFNIMNIFVFLTSIVCEAAMGLSLLVMFNFYYGNEMMNSLNLIKC
uniref:NADH dehydrogenase subunit 4L n=1 Tax=Amblyomma tholloni TaxID=1701308 RepID=UPI0022377A63|nr:NADH dehydrogenase subunit 4L [Amblyomma tholloni]QLD97060.1 NADH dehydrogenase subunit 4L [Amblyomma tholloni]QLD97073.1 NADH dehydrogenase subunit 4L [Amblyomma tholloni]UYB78012.1 NADH dehydrogenase subunit 4L [Amblyomma tholloni]